MRIIWLSLGLLLIAACKPAPTESERLSAIAERVEIIRDDYGVPHIYGQTDADAVFGLLYAQAEDDFPRIERNYIWAMGRLAEVEGEDALHSDLRARLYMTLDEAKAAYADAPEHIRELCRAFADGLNHYLASNPDVQPKLLTRFEPWMPMYFFEGSIGGDIEQIPLGGIREFYGAGGPIEAPRSEEPAGSNGMAISGDLTESGNAMLLINPHTSFYFRGEVHVVSEEGLNAYGAVTWGQFFVYQGFNENNGWMHPSTYADFIDVFVEDVFEKDGKLHYRYGDEVRDVEVGEVTLNYVDDMKMRTRTFPTYRTHHGPITHMVDGKWAATKINWKPGQALEQAYARTKTANYAEFREMMALRTNSSNNTVYADRDGTIGYFHGNFIPKRDPQFDYSKPVDGANPATDWQGLHTVDEVITITNPDIGWIQNNNSTPFTAAGPDSPKAEDYPTYMAPEGENYRGVLAVRLLENVAPNSLTLDRIIDLAYDPQLPAFEALMPTVVGSYDTSNGAPDLAEPVAMLRDWNHTVSTDSVAMTLAHFYGMRTLELYRKNGWSRMETIDWMANTASDAQRLDVLRWTVENLTETYGDWRQPWGEVNRFQRLSGEIGAGFDDAQPSVGVPLASGRWGSLAAYGARRGESTKKLYGYRGNSFVAAVEFGERVRAKTLLAGGQSGDPDSPHFDDQVGRYLDVDFKDARFYREDVEAHAMRRYSPGK
jgi:acyl-homoserine lactone acylase PvdQ